MSWQQSVDQGSLQALEILWVWAMESEINTDEFVKALERDITGTKKEALKYLNSTTTRKR